MAAAPLSRRFSRTTAPKVVSTAAQTRLAPRMRRRRLPVVAKALIIPALLAAALLLLHLRPRSLSPQHVRTPRPIRTLRPERARFSNSTLSVVVLFHNEFASLRHAVESWNRNGLSYVADEVLIFLNGISMSKYITFRVPELSTLQRERKLRLVTSEENLPLGLAITRMVELAKSEYVLLLEKDWELIEQEDKLLSRIEDSKALISSGVADVVRHRHRHDPGVPLHALIMHQGREESILRIQQNLLCYVHHWQNDPPRMYPAQGIMWRCGRGANEVVDVEEEEVFCATSEYCQWTNNPALFRRKWFIEELGNDFKKDYAIEKEKEGSDSPFLDFEYYTNWRSHAWTDRNFTIAVGTGLFRHSEQNEQLNFNTFWYAHYRLTVDLEEIRNMYLRNETQFKKLGGVHFDPHSPEPPTMMERYPIDFVRKYHWKDTFTGTLQTQREMISEVYNPYLEEYRILTEEEWKQTGPESVKARKRVDWRNIITRLHQITEKAMMIAPPEQPHEMTVTLVTSLLDIGRHRLGDDGYQFKRDFRMYLDAMQDWLTHQYPKVVYTTKRIAEELEKSMSDEVRASTKFVYTTSDELKTKWIGPDNYAKIQDIRTSKEWVERAGWLKNSPQAGLMEYNPLVMAKMFMMRDAARENYWNTTHFLFIDAKHNCRNPKKFTSKNDHIIRAHMFDKLLMTHFDYTPSTEVHGFEYKAFNEFCNLKDPEDQQVVKVGRGGIFGGSAFVLEYITAMYDVVLTATLREGLMGTEENIFSVLLYQVPQYVDTFSNNWACSKNVQGDHSCLDHKDQGYNCAIFEWVARDAVDESPR